MKDLCKPAIEFDLLCRACLASIALWVACGCSKPVDLPPKESMPSKGLSGQVSDGNDAARSDPSGAIRFIEIQDALARSEYRDGSESGAFALPETTGGGVGLIDYDRDGRLDIVTSGGGQPDPQRKRMLGHAGNLYRQLHSRSFESSQTAVGLDFSATYHSAIVAADYDSDGLVDLLITGYDCLQWFHNQGDGTFEIVHPIDDPLWSTAAVFFDADQDSDLDLYVVHYANWSWDNSPWCPSQTDSNRRDYCGPTDYVGLRDSLYENLSDGSFVERTPEAFSGIALRGLGVIAADLDGDRDTDLYVTNDVEPNLLFRNDGAFQFTELGRRSGVATNDQGRAEGSMGVAIGDYNNDQKFDLWVTNYADEFNALYRGAGRLSFSYATNIARITATDEKSVGWGTTLCDLELDGDEDIIVINGHLERYSPNRLQRPQILENIQAKRFVLSGKDSPFFALAHEGRGLATGDINRDGLIDLVVSCINAPCAVLENRSDRQGSFLTVRLVGRSSNRDAIGSVVTLQAGDRSWIRQRFAGGSYASTSDSAIHFGIPKHSSAVLRIDWPSGQTTQIPIDNLDTEILVVEPAQGNQTSSSFFHDIQVHR